MLELSGGYIIIICNGTNKTKTPINTQTSLSDQKTPVPKNQSSFFLFFLHYQGGALGQEKEGWENLEQGALEVVGFLSVCWESEILK